MTKEIDVKEKILEELEEFQKDHKTIPEEIEFIKEWEKRTNQVCKPCWELKYCPYGPLVEQFPAIKPTRDDAIEHNEFIEKQLKEGKLKGWRKEFFEKEVNEFDPREYPLKYDKATMERSCIIFGHFCPVYFINESFTETIEKRKISRHIPRKIMLRVVRRDNYTCQLCGKHLIDDEIEFDHKIPLSKGGSTEESNIQLTCIKCNRAKRDRLPNGILKE